MAASELTISWGYSGDSPEGELTLRSLSLSGSDIREALLFDAVNHLHRAWGVEDKWVFGTDTTAEVPF